jgi:hypothetical protein
MFKRASTLVIALLAFVAVSVISPSAVCAGNKSLTFTWNQVISPDFAGWKLFYKAYWSGNLDQANYTEFLDIPYSGVEAPEYSSEGSLTSPDGETHTYYFVLWAYDDKGNWSGPSNELPVEIDFEGPQSPTTLKVIIRP